MNISKCCKYSWMSYYPIKPINNKSSIVKLNRKSGSEKFMNERGGTEGTKILYVKEEGSTYIAFRGTKNRNDMRDAVNILPTETEHGSVHSGFYRKYLDVQNELNNLLIEEDSDNIYFTGHSMGGCLALISSVNSFSILPNKNLYCYMFGSPIIGNKMFIDNAEAVLKSLVSIELESDIVPLIPLNPSFKRPSNVLIMPDNNNIINIMKNHSCMAYYKSLLRKEVNLMIKGKTLMDILQKGDTS